LQRHGGRVWYALTAVTRRRIISSPQILTLPSWCVGDAAACGFMLESQGGVLAHAAYVAAQQL